MKDDPILTAIAARKATLAAAEKVDEDNNEFLAADTKAVCTMLQTTPTTLAGMQALLSYVIECETCGEELLDTYMVDNEEAHAYGLVLLRTLLTALEHMEGATSR